MLRCTNGAVILQTAPGIRTTGRVAQTLTGIPTWAGGGRRQADCIPPWATAPAYLHGDGVRLHARACGRDAGEMRKWIWALFLMAAIYWLVSAREQDDCEVQNINSLSSINLGTRFVLDLRFPEPRCFQRNYKYYQPHPYYCVTLPNALLIVPSAGASFHQFWAECSAQSLTGPRQKKGFGHAGRADRASLALYIDFYLSGGGLGSLPRNGFCTTTAYNHQPGLATKARLLRTRAKCTKAALLVHVLVGYIKRS